MAKTIKKLLSMVIAVVMVLSLIPAVSAAEETVLVGTTEDWNAQIDALQSATAAMTVNIKFTADIAATKELVIPFGINHNVTVDMDGHKLTSTEAIRAFNLHEGTLTIKNGTIEMPGINQPSAGADTTAKDTLDGEFSGYGGLGIVYKADLNLTDVTLKKVTTDNAVGSGGVLYVRSLSTVTLVRSHIVVEQDDTYDAGNAGAIAMTNYSGTPTVYLNDNSSVSGGYALNYGGNFMLSGSARVYIDATSKVFGGKINKGGSHGGGNFYCGNKNTRIYLNGGEIYGGVTESGYGGNLRINAGQLHVKGGKIYGGEAKSVSGSAKINTYGGNIALSSADAHAYLTGGEIYGGRAQSYTGYSTSGGNIYLSSGSLTLDGGAKIYDGEASGTVGVTGGNIYNTLGTITLNDGEISGGSIVSTATNKVCYGGNVYSIGGTLIMNGGKISDGSVVSTYSVHGGNLYMTNNGTTYSKVIMNGGEITGGYIEGSREIYGAAVALYKGSFILNDGYIGNGTVKKLTTATSGGSAGIQIYSATTINAAGDLDAFHMYGGTVEAIALIKVATAVLHEGKTTTDLSKYVGACSTITTEKVDGYYVITHQNTDGTENDVAATCTKAGKINVTCTDCTETVGGTTYGGTYAYDVAALGHTEEVIAAKAPTCNDTGLTEGKKCTVCGEITVAQEEIAATGHTEKVLEGKAPTCNDTGLTEGKVCEICGETITAQEEIAALGHSYEAVYTEPTFEADGFTTYTCGTCGDTYTVIDEGSKLTAVATADGVPFKALQDALNAGGEVVLLQPVTMAEKLVVSNTVTLNLNGQTLGLAAVDNNYGFVVKGDLTVTGEGAILADGMYGIGVTGKLTVESGIFYTTGMADYLIGNWGTTVINGGTFNGIYNCVNNFSGTTEIYGGEFTTAQFDYTGEWESAPLMANAGLTVYGGIFNMAIPSEYIAANLVQETDFVVKTAEKALADGVLDMASNLTLTGKATLEGEIVINLNGYTLNLAENSDNYSVVVKGELTVNGEGTVYAPSVYGIGVSTTGTMLIYGGTFVAGEKSDYLIGNWGSTYIYGGTFQGVYNCVNNFAGVTCIVDGTFSTAEYDYTGEYASADLLADEGMFVSGGTFSKPVDPAYCRSDLCPKDNGDGTYTVTFKAYIVLYTEQQEAAAGSDATFAVIAEGEGLTYQWQYSRNGSVWYNTKMEGFNTDSILVPATLARNGYQYRCIVTDIYGYTATSPAATLTVTQPADAVAITGQPAAQNVFAGNVAVFAVTAEGNGLTYRWQYSKNGTAWYSTAMEGYNTAELKVTATVARNGYQYRCVITDAYGNQVISEAAIMAVTEDHLTTSGPADQVAANGKAVFTVEAAGEGLTYRWQYQRHDSVKWFYTTMEGYATNSLTVTATKARNGYKYRCIVTDAYGNETVSEEAVLIVE